MSKKWYNYFVSVDEAAPGTEAQAQSQPARTPAQTVADIAASVAPRPGTRKPAGRRRLLRRDL